MNRSNDKPMGNNLSQLVKPLLNRKESGKPVVAIVIAGLGGMLAIATLSLISSGTGHLLLMAPFGATCVLLFSVPASPLSQPVNVIGGHVVSTFIGLLIITLFPVEWWSLALAVGLAISAMAMLRITHPPAGADPLVVMVSSAGWDYLLFPVAIGSLALLLIASLFNHFGRHITSR